MSRVKTKDLIWTYYRCSIQPDCMISAGVNMRKIFRFTITQRLVNKKDECINFGDMANNKGVDGYRVKNMILLIEQLSEDVLSIYNSINIMDELLESKIITVKTESPKLLASIKR